MHKETGFDIYETARYIASLVFVIILSNAFMPSH
jgi:hypothetical protein